MSTIIRYQEIYNESIEVSSKNYTNSYVNVLVRAYKSLDTHDFYYVLEVDTENYHGFKIDYVRDVYHLNAIKDSQLIRLAITALDNLVESLKLKID